MFFGTPHNGTGKAHFLGTLQKLASLTLPKGIIQFETSLVNALDKNSETLQSIVDQFSPLMSNFQIFFFWEQEKTDLKYGRDYIVKEANAAPIINNTERSAIAADHRGMCRFRSNTSPGFRTVMAALRRYCQEAPQSVKVRSDRAIRKLNQNRWYQAMEAVNAIESVTENDETWKTARMHQIRELRAIEIADPVVTRTGNLGSWKSARVNQSRWLQDNIASGPDAPTTPGLSEDMLEETAADHAETPENKRIQAMETMDAIKMIAGRSETLQITRMKETRNFRRMGINDTSAMNSLPLPQAEEQPYFLQHESRNPEFWFQAGYPGVRHAMEPSWTVRVIALCFLSSMISAFMTYFLLENVQHAQSWNSLLMRDDYIGGALRRVTSIAVRT